MAKGALTAGPTSSACQQSRAPRLGDIDSFAPQRIKAGAPTQVRRLQRGVRHFVELPTRLAMASKIAERLPKMAVGSLHLEFKKCGRANCRCQRGFLHGPYVYRHRRQQRRQKKEYVPMRRLSEVSLEMERERAE